MNIKQFFQEQGYDISEKLNWDKYLTLWNSWYVGKVRKFHTYYIYNGQTRVKREKKSMQGAKKVAEDWADLLFNERVKISLTNDSDTKALEKIFEDNNSIVTINQGIEKTFALGIGALITSIQNMELDEQNKIINTNNSRLNLEFVEAQKIVPLSWIGTKIIECAFMTYKTIKGINYLYIAMHLLNEKGNYIIRNYKFKVQGKSIINIDSEKEFLDQFDTKNNIPWFSILRPNICNNIDFNTPFSISIYANSIDTLKSLDNAYDAVDNEVVLGRRRIFIAEEMMTYENGEAQLTFDPEDVSIYRMPKSFNKDSMIQQDNADLRTDKYQESVNFQLNILSSKVGFGQERYKFDGANIQTATGVISENSDMFRTLKKHEQVLESSLKTSIMSLAYASTEFLNIPINADKITIDFDDSIIEDKGAEQIRAQTEVGNGTRSKHSYMKDVRNLSDDQVEKELKQIKDEKISNQEAFGFEEPKDVEDKEEE